MNTVYGDTHQLVETSSLCFVWLRLVCLYTLHQVYHACWFWYNRVYGLICNTLKLAFFYAFGHLAKHSAAKRILECWFHFLRPVYTLPMGTF